jgi:propanol-preferring alcohol dehydrogenase
MKVKGVYLPGNKEAHLKEWELPDPKEDEVLVKIKAAALCRSDMSIYYGKPLIPGYPSGTFITGHEPRGIISKTGPCVKTIKEGDRVSLIAFVGCGHCQFCRGGEPNLCDSTGVLGFTTHGADAEFIVVPERMCLPLPKTFSYEVGAITTDVIGNLYSTMKSINLCGGDLVAITGLGPMGLSGVMVAVSMGATVIGIDPLEERLTLAKDLGAHYTFSPEKSDVYESVLSISKSGVDKSVDCTGVESAINLALDITKKKGIVAQVGEVGQKQISIKPSPQLIWKKLTYIGSWYFKLNEWEEIIDFISNKIGEKMAASIISHKYPLEEESVQEAFRLFDKRKTMKVLFNL